MIRVRPAVTADLRSVELLLRELAALHAQLQRGFFRPPRGASLSEAGLLRMLDKTDERLLLAFLPEGEEPVGLLHLQVHETPSAPSLSPRRRAHVEELLVKGSARRRGCGRMLMEEGTRWAKARGAEQLVLTVWRGNEEAEAFYRSLGYAAVSTVLAREL